MVPLIFKYLMGNDGYTGVFWYPQPFPGKNQNTPWAIKYLDIHHTTKWCTRKSCKRLRRFTSQSLIYCVMRFHPVAVENRRKTRLFSTLSALRQVFITSQIIELEANRILLQLFCIHQNPCTFQKTPVYPSFPILNWNERCGDSTSLHIRLNMKVVFSPLKSPPRGWWGVCRERKKFFHNRKKG